MRRVGWYIWQGASGKYYILHRNTGWHGTVTEQILRARYFDTHAEAEEALVEIDADSAEVARS